MPLQNVPIAEAAEASAPPLASPSSSRESRARISRGCGFLDVPCSAAAAAASLATTSTVTRTPGTFPLHSGQYDEEGEDEEDASRAPRAKRRRLAREDAITQAIKDGFW